jgi:simple sugar transport system permease protein
VVVKAIPLTLTGLAGALCYRMLLWNIGMEGQLHLGALATVAVVRYCFVDSSLAMFVLMTLAAAIAGGLWAALAGFLKARFHVTRDHHHPHAELHRILPGGLLHLRA